MRSPTPGLRTSSRLPSRRTRSKTAHQGDGLGRRSVTRTSNRQAPTRRTPSRGSSRASRRRRIGAGTPQRSRPPVRVTTPLGRETRAPSWPSRAIAHTRSTCSRPTERRSPRSASIQRRITRRCRAGASHPSRAQTSPSGVCMRRSRTRATASSATSSSRANSAARPSARRIAGLSSRARIGSTRRRMRLRVKRGLALLRSTR
jgi:hypothetical protein